MATIKFCGETYECTKALRGDNFVHLIDDAGCIIAAFEGVVNFSSFTLSGCTWTYVASRNTSTTNVYYTSYSSMRKELSIPGVTADDMLTVIDASDFAWVQENLMITLQNDKVVLHSARAPSSAITITFSMMQYTKKAI